MKNSTLLSKFIAYIVFISMPCYHAHSQSEILGHIYGGSLNGHSYYVSDCYTYWQQAYDAATEMGGYLVTINSDEENDFIGGFAPYMFPEDPSGAGYVYGGAWTGLISMENNGICDFWQWVNGESIVYTKWAGYPDEPLNTNCGTTLIVGFCSTGYCEFYPQQIEWRTAFFDFQPRQYIVEFNSDPGCSNSNKSYVCHNGNTICVNNDAIPAHVNHGDYAGPCGPCNANYQQPEKMNDPIAGNIIISMLSDGQDNDVEINLNEINQVIKFYPNPVVSSLQILFASSQDKVVITLTSLSGQLLYKTTWKNMSSTDIDLSPYPSGIYLLVIQTGNDQYQQKIAKL